jgi:hypothetical protein
MYKDFVRHNKRKLIHRQTLVEILAMTTPQSSASYGARNAINAESLRNGITRRSQVRGDTDEIRDWLLNHFYRYLVGNFKPAQPIASLNEAREALAPAPVPEWLSKRFKKPLAATEAPMVWVDGAHPQLLLLENRLVEFLQSRAGTNLEGKLQRITCTQALALWEREHQAMAGKIAQGWRQSQPDAIRTLLETEHGRFVELLPDSGSLRAEMAFETYVMRHCLGQFADRKALTGGYGERYARLVEAGELRLFSFRDTGGQPHITISVIVKEQHPLAVDQVKGKQNRPPISRYVEDVLACLNHLGTSAETPPDCIEIGVVRTAHDWRRLEDVDDPESQMTLISQHPKLFLRLKQPSVMAQWLVAAREPGLLAAHPPRSAALRYALGCGGSRHVESASPAPFATEGVPWPGCDAALARDALAWRSPWERPHP